MRGGGLRGRIFPWRNLSWGKRISMKGEQDFLALFEKTMKKKYEKFFLPKKLKGLFLLNALLFTLKFLTVLKKY